MPSEGISASVCVEVPLSVWQYGSIGGRREIRVSMYPAAQTQPFTL
jgi:hypothetical protein